MKKELTYELTPKGVLSLNIEDEKLLDALMDSLELQARRRNCNAILLNAEGGKFISVELDTKKRGK